MWYILNVSLFIRAKVIHFKCITFYKGESDTKHNVSLLPLLNNFQATTERLWGPYHYGDQLISGPATAHTSTPSSWGSTPWSTRTPAPFISKVRSEDPDVRQTKTSPDRRVTIHIHPCRSYMPWLEMFSVPKRKLVNSIATKFWRLKSSMRYITVGDNSLSTRVYRETEKIRKNTIVFRIFYFL